MFAKYWILLLVVGVVSAQDWGNHRLLTKPVQLQLILPSCVFVNQVAGSEAEMPVPGPRFVMEKSSHDRMEGWSNTAATEILYSLERAHLPACLVNGLPRLPSVLVGYF